MSQSTTTSTSIPSGEDSPTSQAAAVSPKAELGLDGPSKEQAGKDEVPKEQLISYWELLRGADTLDILLMVTAAIGAMGNGVAWPVFSIVFAEFSDAFGAPGSDFLGQISEIAVKFVYLAIGSMVGSYLQTSCSMWAGHRQASRMRQKYLAAVLKQDMSYFDTQATASQLLMGLNEDSTLIQASISEKAMHFLQHVTTFVAGIAVAFAGGWDMTLVMIGTLPLIAAAGGILARVSAVMGAVTQKANASASGYAQQQLQQIRTVAAYGGQERALQEYQEALEMPTRTAIRQSMYTGFALGSVNAVVYFTYSIAYYYGAWRVSTDDYTGGQVLQVFVAALLGGFSLGQAAPIMEAFTNGRAAGTRLLKVINRQPIVDIDADDGKTIEPAALTGSLAFRDVTFAYPTRPELPVFRGFTLSIPGGKTVALVGSSGSGKSTAVQLIERFYDPHGGTITLDGVDLRSLNLRWLRTQIGLVSQEPTLFATTILENIQMGRQGATEQEVIEAAKAANAHTFISHLPLGYNTQVGERGLQLSGGQKQRIAIARAVLKNPKILLLDEATSALDTHSERVVQAALDGMMVGRTTVVVAHRLSTIRNADLIAVVKQGTVAELGSHDQLIAQPSSMYSTLVAIQMQEEAAKGEDDDSGSADDDEDEADRLEAVLEEDPAVIEIIAEHNAHTTADHAIVPRRSIQLSKNGSAELTEALNKGGRISIDRHGKRTSGELKVVVDADHQHHKGRAGSGKVDEAKETVEEVKVPMSRLFAMNKPETVYGVIGCIASGVSGCIQPAFAFLIASFIIVFYDTPKSEMLSEASFWSGMFAIIAGANFTAVAAQQYCFGKMGAELARRIRLLTLGNLFRQEIGFFDHEKNSSGVLTTKLATDAALVRGAVADSVGVILQNIVCLAAGYLIAFIYDWRMALLITGALPFMIIGSVVYYKNMSSEKSGSSALFASANQAVSDAFTSIRVVQAYNLQGHMCSLYSRLVHDADGQAFKKTQVSGLVLGYSQLSIFAVYGLIIYFGGVEVDSGRVDFDGMLKSFLAILLAAMGVAQAQIGFPDMGKAKGAVQSIFPLIDRVSAIDPSSEEGLKKGSGPNGQMEGAIQLVNVKFAYPARPSVIVFRDFSLDIPAGQMVALVGESGSGKSTIVGLVLRYYDVLAGTVLVDGHDIRSLNLKWLRSHIGLVSQEPLLFNCSVLENIRYAKPSASMEEVEAAARAANAYDFIMALPEGFNTHIGEKGMQLSGGQKQRVAVARAILRSPRILLLDEATSALDAASEKLVQEALDTIMVGRTSIVVAHRLSTIRNANKIALVYRGQVLEQGTHADLMAIPDGGYARLVAAQGGANEGSKSVSRSQSKALSRAQSRLEAGNATAAGNAGSASDK